MAVEIVTGMAFTAIFAGLLFGRFSRAKAQNLFSDDAVGPCTSAGRP
jgi:hypothetical protein